MKTFKEYGLPPSAAKGAKAHIKPLPKKKPVVHLDKDDSIASIKVYKPKEDIERRADFQMTKKTMPDGSVKFVKAPKKTIEIGKGKYEDMTKPLTVEPIKRKVDLKGLKKAVKFYDKPLKQKGYPEQENKAYVKEAIGPDDADDKGEYDYEGEMAKNQLNTMIDAAKELHDMLGDDDNLPEWVQSKITKATDYIDSVRDYLKSESES